MHFKVSKIGLGMPTCAVHIFAPLSRGFEATITTALRSAGLASTFKLQRLRLGQGSPCLASSFGGFLHGGMPPCYCSARLGFNDLYFFPLFVPKRPLCAKMMYSHQSAMML